MTLSCAGIWLKCSCDSSAQLDPSTAAMGRTKGQQCLTLLILSQAGRRKLSYLPHGSCCKETQPDSPFSLGASEPLGSTSGKFSAVAMGSVNAVGCVKLNYVLHYNNWIRLSIVIHQ